MHPFIQAEQKAEQLLRDTLTPQQLCQYETSRQFTVRGSRGHRQYIIVCSGSTVRNVCRRNRDGSKGRRYCAWLRGVPPADSFLAQKLIIESDEGRFLRTAMPSAIWYWAWRSFLAAVILGTAIIVLVH
jgi:hypothetical protein